MIPLPCHSIGEKFQINSSKKGGITNFMRCNYHPETDSLFIHLSEGPSVDSIIIDERNIVLDFDVKGRLIGIEIFSEASNAIDLSSLEKAGVLNISQPTPSEEYVSDNQRAVAD